MSRKPSGEFTLDSFCIQNQLECKGMEQIAAVIRYFFKLMFLNCYTFLKNAASREIPHKCQKDLLDNCVHTDDQNKNTPLEGA